MRKPWHGRWQRSLPGLTLCAVVVLTLGASVAAVAKPQGLPAVTAQDLYAAGVREHQSGNHEKARVLLERAAAIEPDNADVRLHLGLVFMAERRLDEAERELLHALKLAPNYVDVEIALARLDLWRDRHPQAEARAARLLRANPGRPDVIELAASVATKAAPSQTTAVETPPPPALRLSRLDASIGYSHLSGGRSPWRDVSLAGSLATGGGDTLSVLVEHASRFGRTDTYGEVRLDTMVTPKFGVFALAGGAPNADFKPEGAIGAGGWWSVSGSDDVLHAVRLIADAKYAAFATGDVESLVLGVEAEFFDGDLLLTARQINLIDETGKYRNGYALQLRLQANERLAVFGGWAQAPDTSEGRTFETRTAYGGLQLALWDDVFATATFAHDELEGLYTRTSGNLAVSYRFGPS